MLTCGRWGEGDTKKGPVDLFSPEPTEEARRAEETLDHGDKGLLGIKTKIPSEWMGLMFLHAEDGT